MADVTIYGRIDTGFQYSRNGLSGVAKKNDFGMVSGQHTGSRIGVKASENINGLQIGFVLENGYNSNNGEAGQGGRLFGRETSLFLGGSWGKFVFGRMSPVTADAGSVSLYGGVLNAFDFGRGLVATGADSNIVQAHYRNNNSISYLSPVFGGFKFGATYTAGDTGRQFTAGNDRLLAVAGVYNAGNVTLGAFVNYVNALSAGNDPDDPWDVTVGGNYNFGFMKLYASAQYFKYAPLGDVKPASLATGKGWKASVSADAPLAGGTLMGGFDYLDADVDGGGDFTAYGVGAKYTYKPAKSTLFYVGAGYRYEKVKVDGVKEDITKKFTLGSGAVYYF